MVKETKFFRKQAVKAERMARSVSDAEISQRYLNMAKAYRSQADVLKAKKKAKKVKKKAKKKSGKKRR
jgi:L-arabinose isomerase